MAKNQQHALPGPARLLRARGWLRMGCPIAGDDINALEARETLLGLINALPALLPVYRYGTAENVAAWRDEEAAEAAEDADAEMS